jgi:SAM-dependent methyltransferase
MAPKMPLTSVRGRIRHWIERHADKLGDDVLEIGSRMPHPAWWWTVNRDLAQGKWLGIDMQPGHGVDQVADIHHLPHDWTSRFSGVLCSEVLEHVRKPWKALTELRRVTKPGGYIIVTTLFAFPEHGFPDDYFRYSRSGLASLLSDAGYTDIETDYAGEISLMLDDHGEGAIHPRTIPMHVFAVARC